MSLIYFDGICDEESARIVNDDTHPNKSNFNIVLPGQVNILINGEERKCKSTGIDSTLSKDKDLLAFVGFEFRNSPQDTSNHIAVLLAKIEEKQIYYLCNHKNPIFHESIRVLIAPMIEKNYGMEFKLLPTLTLGKLHSVKYPDCCALIALWVFKKIIEGEVPVEKIKYPAFNQMHKFRLGLKLEQDVETKKMKTKKTECH